MIKHRDRGAPFQRLGPAHVFPFGGLWFTTAVWSDEPSTVLYAGDNELAANHAALRVNAECAARVESALGNILKKIDRR